MESGPNLEDVSVKCFPINLILLISLFFAVLSCSKKEEDEVLADNEVELPPLSSFSLQVGANVAFNYKNFIFQVTSGEKCRASAVDSEGNVYCAGDVEGDFGDESGGDRDAYIMKVNPEGIIQWVTQLGSTAVSEGEINSSSSVDICYDLAVDSEDDVYCVGSTFSNLQVPLLGSGEDAFVMKLNSNGEIQWVKHLTSELAQINNSSQADKCFAIAIDASNNIFCGGQTLSSFVETQSGLGDIFIAKLDSSGALLWVRHIGETTKVSFSLDTTEEEACLSLSTDSAGNVFCGGYTYGSLEDVNLDVHNSSDLFLLKMNASGVLQWVNHQGGASSFDTDMGEECKDIVADGNGNVFCGGATYGSLMEENLDEGNSSDIFIIKFNSIGVIQWGEQLGATSRLTLDMEHEINPDNMDNLFSIVRDSEGNIFVGGDTFSDLGEPNGGNNDIFVVKYSGQGELLRVTQLGATTQEDHLGIRSTAQSDYCYGLSLDSEGNLFCGGFTTGELTDVKPESGYTDADIFILKLNSNGSL